jgi:hypothetical protein
VREREREKREREREKRERESLMFSSNYVMSNTALQKLWENSVFNSYFLNSKQP